MKIPRPICSVDDKNISVFVEYKSENSFTQYAYYLYDCKNNIIEKRNYNSSSNAVFDISKIPVNTFCFVKVFIKYKSNENSEYKKVVINSNKVICYSSQRKEEFEEYLRKAPESIPFELPFWKTSYPYQDFLLAYSFSDNCDMSELSLYANKEGFNTFKIYGSFIMTSSENCYSKSDILAFSGITRTKEKLIYGYKDISNVNSSDISEMIGNYSGIFNCNNKIVLTTDYFGISKLYYFKDDDILIVSNRYHLLLIAAQKLFVNRIINFPKVYAYLSMNNQVIMQNYSREMNVQDFYVLPIDEYIEIDTKKGTATVKKKEIYYDLSSPQQFNEPEYHKLLNYAVDELLDNARVALESKHFNHYVVDLTGGLDSRIVFSVLSRFPEYKSKIVPHTVIGDRYNQDYLTAFKLLSIYPLEIRDIPEIEPNEIDYASNAMSYILGTTSEYSIYGGSPYKDTCIFSGFYGEIVGRAYYSSIYENSALDDSFIDATNFFDEFSFRMGGSMMYDAKALLSEQLKEECIKIPGRSLMEKYENHYLYYRNGIHFNDVLRSSIIAPCWGVLQSKYMFKLKNMVFPYKTNIKLQLDILYKINPEIAAVEFGDEKYEKSRDELHSKFNCYPKTNPTISVNNYLTLFKRAKIKTTALNTNRFSSIYNKEYLLAIVGYLVNKKMFDKKYALDIYNYIVDSEGDARYDLFAKKIVSLYFEVK